MESCCRGKSKNALRVVRRTRGTDVPSGRDLSEPAAEQHSGRRRFFSASTGHCRLANASGVKYHSVKSGGMTLIKRIVIGLLLTVVLLGLARRLSTRRPRDVGLLEPGLSGLHTTVTEQVGPGEPSIRLKLEPPDGGTPYILFETGGAGSGEIAMNPMQAGEWAARLPDLGKGGRLRYAIRVVRKDGGVTRLPSGDGYFLIKFKGNVSPIVLALHIAAMFGAFYFMFQCLMGAVQILRGAEGKRGTVKSMRWVLALSFLGGWPLGFILNYQAFGPLWEGIPFGWDITDNKTQIMFILWLVCGVLVSGSFFGWKEDKDIIGPRGLAIAVLVSFVVSLVLYLVPHSI